MLISALFAGVPPTRSSNPSSRLPAVRRRCDRCCVDPSAASLRSGLQAWSTDHWKQLRLHFRRHGADGGRTGQRQRHGGRRCRVGLSAVWSRLLWNQICDRLCRHPVWRRPVSSQLCYCRRSASKSRTWDGWILRRQDDGRAVNIAYCSMLLNDLV